MFAKYLTFLLLKYDEFINDHHDRSNSSKKKNEFDTATN